MNDTLSNQIQLLKSVFKDREDVFETQIPAGRPSQGCPKNFKSRRDGIMVELKRKKAETP